MSRNGSERPLLKGMGKVKKRGQWTGHCPLRPLDHQRILDRNPPPPKVTMIAIKTSKGMSIAPYLLSP